MVTGEFEYTPVEKTEKRSAHGRTVYRLDFLDFLARVREKGR